MFNDKDFLGAEQMRINKTLYLPLDLGQKAEDVPRTHSQETELRLEPSVLQK